MMLFKLIAGPCAIESEEMAMDIAEKMKAITDKLGIDYTFKGSFDKANRTSIHSKRGLGIDTSKTCNLSDKLYWWLSTVSPAILMKK